MRHAEIIRSRCIPTKHERSLFRTVCCTFCNAVFSTRSVSLLAVALFSSRYLAPMTDSPPLTRADLQGSIRMTDVSDQPDSVRTAVAKGTVVIGLEAFEHVQNGTIRKGDVLSVAQIAGIMGAKQTSKLLPLCHDVQIDGVEVEFTLNAERHAIDIRAFTKSNGLTGVEMEALTAVSIAALTVYDMCKSVTKEIRVNDVHLLAKTGGQSGNWKSNE